MAKRFLGTGKNVKRQPAPVTKHMPVTSPVNDFTTWMMILVAVLPVLVSGETFDPVLSIRYLFLSNFVLSFTIYCYLKKDLFIDLILPRPVNTLFLLGIIYGLCSITSMFFAVNTATALYEISRYFLNLVLLFLITVTVNKKLLQVNHLFNVIVVISFIQSLAGILQYFGLVFNDIPLREKPFGLMGYRTLFGSGMVLLVPFVTFVYYQGNRLWKFLSAGAFVGIILSILLSQTRSAWLALFAMMFASVLLICFFLKDHRKKWMMGVAAVSCLFILLACLLIMFDGDGSFSSTLKNRAVAVIQSAPDYNSISTGRLVLWKKTLKLISANPYFGVGPGNWHIAVPVFTSSGTAWARGEQVPSWPHNVYLQLAAEAGVPAALLYLGTLAMIFLTGIRTLSGSASKEGKVLNILMFSGLIAFCADSMFSFPHERIEHCLYVILMAGIILGSYSGENDKKTNGENFIKRWIIFPMVFIVLVNTVIAFKKYNFENHLNLAIYYIRQQQYEEAIFEAGQGKSWFVTLGPNQEPIEMQTANAYIKLKNYSRALSELETAKKYHPNSGRIYTSIGVAYAEQGKYTEAVNAYLTALKFTPDFHITLSNLAVVYFKISDYPACIKTINRLNKPYRSSLEFLNIEAQKRLGTSK